VATVAELKGCMAHGYTREEALKEIQDAIQLHLDALVDKGIDIPKPACLTV
jgi:predicted RNase H-like HicB family nuclease